MSHYSKCRTKITDKKMLIKALEDLGFTNKVVSHDKAKHLYGYQGDKREQTAEVIIPRCHIGRASNDIGFKQQEDGTFEAIISNYDKQSLRYNDEWLGRLSQRYAYNQLKEDLDTKGFFIQEEEEINGEIHLTCTTYG